jgi:orotidine-5'-phosphate decarboxylase
MDTYELQQIGVAAELSAQTLQLARLAQSAGLDGVVSAAVDVPSIKAACGDGFITVTPGIRLLEDVMHDQVRVVTPEQAQQLGSDYLVIGRSITQADSPANRVRLILDSLV